MRLIGRSKDRHKLCTGACDDAIIDVGCNHFTVTHSVGDDTVLSLNCQSALTMAGGTLTFESYSVINNAFTFSNGIVAGVPLDVFGATTLVGSAADDNFTFGNDGLEWTSDIVNRGTFHCYGTSDMSGGGGDDTVTAGSLATERPKFRLAGGTAESPSRN